MLTFGILGPLTVTTAGSEVTLAAAKHRILLSHLLLQHNRVIATDDLVESVWDGSPPRQARNALQNYLMRLRHSLSDTGEVIRTVSPGYLIAIPEDALDLNRFRTLVARAQTAGAAGDKPAEEDLLSSALKLWRGQPLTDVPSLRLQREIVPRLVEERLQAIERHIDVALELGRHRALITQLRELTTAHPLREGLWSRLMLALYRSDRQAEALGAFHELSTILRDELAIDPCDAVQQLHQHILRRHADLGPPAARDTATVLSDAGTPARAAPFEIPGDMPTFVGRTALIDSIRSLLAPTGSDASTVPGVIISGLPGVGKTALAIHVAHRMLANFPDGHLYLNMRGYSRGQAMSAEAALTRSLRTMGVASENMPADIDEQSALWRRLLNGRRVLIILDNVASADQVRPMLPGRPGSAVLVTSRDTLSGLAAVNGLRPVPVDVISDGEATDLLATILGDRVAREPEASLEFAALCGNLPLALRIGAALLAGRPGQSVTSYVAEIRSEGRVSALAIDGDDDAMVDAAFDLSYQTLKPEVARLFRLISLIPGPSFDRWAAANIADVPLAVAGRMLERLATANVVQRRADRYYFHDLVKEYAHAKSLEYDGRETSAALRRLFDYYLRTADRCTRLLNPDLPRLAAPASSATVLMPPVHEKPLAARWFEVEIANIEAMIRSDAPHTDGLPVWLLADAVLGYVDRQRLDNTWHTISSVARDAAVRHGDQAAEAAMCRSLGKLFYLQARYDRAEALWLYAKDLYERIADPVGAAMVRNGLSGVAGSLLNYAKANEYLRPALVACRTAGDRTVEAETLTNLGTSLMLTGEAEEAVACLTSACRIADELGLGHIHSRAESAIALNDLYRGALDAAAARFTHALDTSRAVGYPTVEAQTLRNLAEVDLEFGRPRQARERAAEALALAEKLDAYWNAMGARITLGLSALAVDDVDTATACFSVAHEERAKTVRFWFPFAMLGLAACERLGGSPAVALDLARDACSDPRPRVRGQAHLESAKAQLALGDTVPALRYAAAAQETAAASGYRLDLARAFEVRADICARMDEPRRSADYRSRAGLIFAEIRRDGDEPFGLVTHPAR
ncbi:regulatory protein AfsR [Virgisporangium aliadipatigenens]|uniref:Regulatory protein AfsR n=1 Tax=Virgisporangium aliadipatigenens TaxID=741659 RepID=A0A8J4DP92_9ACTN|nr:AfsR/SARP family transcriptional regulator [Virgisporangium aliadipatigenens]GIJ44232.1 regulatory protein AfsR [Virgisporangium aliadipatigenens]